MKHFKGQTSSFNSVLKQDNRQCAPVGLTHSETVVVSRLFWRTTTGRACYSNPSAQLQKLELAVKLAKFKLVNQIKMGHHANLPFTQQN